MKKLAIYGLENDELFLIALMAVSAEKLIEHILRVDEILSFDMLETFVIKVDKLIEIIQELIFKMTDVVWFFTRDGVVNEVNILVVFRITKLFEEHHNMVLRDIRKPFSLRCVFVPTKKVMSRELLFKLFVYF